MRLNTTDRICLGLIVLIIVVSGLACLRLPDHLIAPWTLLYGPGQYWNSLSALFAIPVAMLLIWLASWPLRGNESDADLPYWHSIHIFLLISLGMVAQDACLLHWLGVSMHEGMMLALGFAAVTLLLALVFCRRYQHLLATTDASGRLRHKVNSLERLQAIQTFLILLIAYWIGLPVRVSTTMLIGILTSCIATLLMTWRIYRALNNRKH